ncbi:MAG: hypothetical protein GX372_09620 [Ignavibacteria bacterium]|jgi:TldD protein|nr:hypothetical protein [Ignavibacteria bacterium]
MKLIKILVLSLVFTLSISLAYGQSEVLKSAVKTELDRSMREFSKEEKAPYFLSYYVTETMENRLTASFGKLINVRRYSGLTTDQHTRIVDIDLRVGSYDFDNTHVIRGAYDPFGRLSVSSSLPIEDDENAIRVALWNNTEKAYRDAAEKFEKAVSNKAVKVAEEDSSADFSKELPNKYREDFKKRYYSEVEARGDVNAFVIDTAKWNAIICRLSDKFNKYPWIFDGSVTLNSTLKNKYYVNSEGSEISFPETYVRIMISAKTKAEDGMSLPLYKDYFAFSCDGLPSEELMAQDIDKMIDLLDRLRTAETATTFTGPAILSGEASGVFFHEIFGHRVEGHREKDPAFSHTFKEFVGKKILPEFMSVTFDPSMKEINGREISGYYKYDDEGQKGERVETVKDGIFQTYIMSRSPIKGFPNSNGHGRRSSGHSAVARQSNLIVSSTNQKTISELRNMLIEEAKKQGKEYGLFFDRVTGGFTLIDRSMPNSFNVTPLVVYKIYVDGRPDELVRGVDLIGTPLTTFEKITATGDDLGIFNGMCGAESGWVPVSASSPSLFVSTIEVQKKSKSQTKLPILPAPVNPINP